MVYLALAALVAAAITVHAVRRAGKMPDWMSQADEQVHVQYQEWIIRPRALGDRLGDRK